VTKIIDVAKEDHEGIISVELDEICDNVVSIYKGSISLVGPKD
jgi:hypothetical protein